MISVRVSRSTRVESVVQMVIMLAIGAAAGAGSFTHVHDVAAAHGQEGWLAWADAVVLELMSIASGLELRRRKRCHAPVGFPAAVMVASVALSLSAQVVQAQPSVIGWIAAAIPALGFLVMVKIALAQAGSSRVLAVGGPDAVPGSDAVTGPEVLSADVPVLSGRPLAESGSVVVPATASDDRQVPPPPAAAEDGKGTTAKIQIVRAPSADEVVVALLPAARAAASVLESHGQRLSRHGLAEMLREEGHRISNARASALLEVLRSERGVVPLSAVPGVREAAGRSRRGVR